MKSPRTLAVWGAALLAVTFASCSKPVSPVPASTSNVDAVSDAGAWDPPGGQPQVSRARLRFVGEEARLVTDQKVRLDRHVEWFVDALEAPEAASSTPVPEVAHGSVLQAVRWRRANGPGWIVETHPRFVPADPRLPDGTFPDGFLLVALEAPEAAGGGSVWLWVRVDFAPEEVWWAGPDPSRFPPSSDGDGRAVDVLDWASFSTSPAWPPDGRGAFGPDSFRVVPVARTPVNHDLERRTFYEIWGDRIYARNEGDVVHQGAWVVFVNGGFDRDSPYAPVVSADDPALPSGFASQPDLYSLLIARDRPIGSPIGFRLVVPMRLDDGRLVLPPQTVLYPAFDPRSVFRAPHVAGYWPVPLAGTSYACVYAQDAEGRLSPAPGGIDMLALTDRVDAGGGTPEERRWRRQVLRFEVRAGGAAARGGKVPTAP